MSSIFPDLPHSLGAYTLTRLLEQRGESEVYAASQGSVGREVALEVLRPGADPAMQAAFLATARQRVAAAQLPHAGQVYESLCAGGLWFLTQELPQGRSLAEYAEADLPGIPALCRIIIAASELYDSCAAAGYATLPLTAASVYLTPAGKPRFLSPVVAAAVDSPAAEDMAALGALLLPYVPEVAEGRTRMLTLLQWMREGYEGQQLLWEQVRTTAQTFLAQLGEADTPAEQATEEGILRRRRRRRRRVAGVVLYVLGVAALGGLVASAGFLFRSPHYVSRPAVRADEVALRLPQDQLLLVANRPVSVCEYAAFLVRVEQMSAEELNTLQSILEEQPPTLIPEHWEEQRQGRADAPVTGVSYRQALLYAHAAGAVLPTAAQLQCVFDCIGAAGVQEWTNDLFAGQGCGLLRGDMPLAISPTAPFEPLPLPHSDYAAPTLGFRTAHLQPTNE